MNEVFRRIGITVPVFQAPIGSLTTASLAAAVTNAGGVGHLACTWRSPSELEALFADTRSQTSGPFGANFVIGFSIDEKLAVALQARVPVISFFWGDARPYIERVKASGAIAVQVVATIHDAVTAARAGFDVIVVQGREAGGHVRGDLGLMSLLPQVVQAVGDVPVLAAGGIVDRSGASAALALGASGVWVGTRFIATPESNAHAEYRKRILEANGDDTVYSGVFNIGWENAPMRTLRNSTILAWEAAGKPTSGRPGEGDVVARRSDGSEIQRYSFSAPTAAVEGDIEAMAMYAGAGVGLIHAIEPAADVVRDLAQGLLR